MPCIVDHAPSSASIGHSSHVANVRFLKGPGGVVGCRVASVGGQDHTLIQWRMLGQLGSGGGTGKQTAAVAAANATVFDEIRLLPPTALCENWN